MSKKLKIVNINKHFPKKEILKDISFECSKGDIIGIIGPNGSGKSSLFKIISGLWEANSGSILFDDINFLEYREKIVSNIGSFIEYPTFYEDLTARQNFEILIRLHKVEDRSFFEKLLEIFEINSFIDIKVKKCSLGMKQKIGLVMALLQNPEVIILDEPTNSLDINAVKALHKLLLSIKKDKIILISSHILEELDSLCDKVYVINNGQLRSNDDTKDNIIYSIEFDSKLQNTNSLVNCKVIEMINDTLYRIECDDLNKLFKECNDKNINVVKIKSESSAKKLFNEVVGD